MIIELIVLMISMAKSPEPVKPSIDACGYFLGPHCHQVPAPMVFMNGSPMGNDDEVLTICRWDW